MRGWGFKAQINATYLYVRIQPFHWETQRDLMAPRRWGIGFWITRDDWT